jgi:hypothetical protein
MVENFLYKYGPKFGYWDKQNKKLRLVDNQFPALTQILWWENVYATGNVFTAQIAQNPV